MPVCGDMPIRRTVNQHPGLRQGGLQRCSSRKASTTRDGRLLHFKSDGQLSSFLIVDPQKMHSGECAASVASANAIARAAPPEPSRTTGSPLSGALALFQRTKCAGGIGVGAE